MPTVYRHTISSDIVTDLRSADYLKVTVALMSLSSLTKGKLFFINQLIMRETSIFNESKEENVDLKEQLLINGKLKHEALIIKTLADLFFDGDFWAALKQSMIDFGGFTYGSFFDEPKILDEAVEERLGAIRNYIIQSLRYFGFPLKRLHELLSNYVYEPELIVFILEKITRNDLLISTLTSLLPHLNSNYHFLCDFLTEKTETDDSGLKKICRKALKKIECV